MSPLVVFGRAPVPGRCKTRLVPALGTTGATALYRAFLADTLERVADATFLPALWLADDQDHPALFDATTACGRALADRIRAMPRRTQPAGDLGERMRAALAEGIEMHGRALVIGSDAPTLPRAYLRAAHRALDAVDLVLGPSADGGYYLIGARVVPTLAGVRWSTRHALTDTRRVNSMISLAFLSPWYDVDTPRDLSLLRAHLSLAPMAAPRSAAALDQAAHRAAHDGGPR